RRAGFTKRSARLSIGRGSLDGGSAGGDARLREQLVRERIGAKLDFDRLRPVPLAALPVVHRPSAVSRPQGFPLPAGLRVVDASIDVLGEEAHRIGDSYVD